MGGRSRKICKRSARDATKGRARDDKITQQYQHHQRVAGGGGVSIRKTAASSQQNTGKVQGKPENLTNAGKGRVKGVKNKLTGQVKEMILAALDKAGGVDYLAGQAEANPAAFMSLVGKVLPLTLQGNPDQPIAIQQVSEDADAVERGIARLAAGIRTASVAGGIVH